MVLDIVTAALIVIPMGIGMARGFLYVLTRFLGWIGAVAGGFFLAPTLKGILAKSALGRRIHDGIEERFTEMLGIDSGDADAPADGAGAGTDLAGGATDGGSAGNAGADGAGGIGAPPGSTDDGMFGTLIGGDSGADPSQGLPAVLMDNLQNSIDATVTNVVDAMVNSMTDMILTVISFLLIVALIRILLIVVIRPISRLRGNNPVSFVNKLMGLAVGSIEGLLLAFLFLAALVPVMQMSSPETAASIAEGLKNSYLAGTLYDGNLLLAIFGHMGM